jgi:hypothetical protein
MKWIDFSRLFQRHGGYSLPVLIELKHPERTSWYFTSNKTDLELNGKLYKSVPMNYKFPTSTDGIPQGGSLEIEIDQQMDNVELLKFFDELDHRATIDVVGLISEGELVELSQITQRHGSLTWDGEKITWSMGADDRMNMQINPYVFDNDALTG